MNQKSIILLLLFLGILIVLCSCVAFGLFYLGFPVTRQAGPPPYLNETTYLQVPTTTPESENTQEYGLEYGQSNPYVSGKSLCSDILCSDTWNYINTLEKVSNTDCLVPQVKNTEILEMPSNLKFDSSERMISGTWKEIWTIDRCSEDVQYEIMYTADGYGGTVITVKSF